MVTAIGCPDDVLLSRGARGDLSPDEAEQLALHLEQCPACARRLDSVTGDNQFGQALRASQQLAAPAEDSQIVAVMDNLLRLPAQAAPAGTTEVFGAAGRETPQPGGADETEEDFRGLLAPAQQPDELGRFGPYRILGLLPKGGMGLVFRAQDAALKRPVALKVLRPELARKRSARERFVREAQAAAALRHDHVVPIYQVGEVDGVPFLAMPLLEGMSLEELLRKTGKLPVAQVLRMGEQIALGLAVAHEHGLVHRDIKPANLFLESGGAVSSQSGIPFPDPPLTTHLSPLTRVKILDFGLARPVEGDSDVTASGLIVGTPAYMAPEQARAEKVDHRCDLFSLGCVLYRMCTGQLPFPGKNTTAVLVALATAEPVPPAALDPAIPQPLSALIEELLAKDPARRPTSAREVAQRLHELEQEWKKKISKTEPEALAKEPGTLASGAGHVRGGQAPNRRRRALLIAAGLLFLIGGTVAVVQIAFPTAEGTLLVQIDDPKVEARFKNGILQLYGPDGKVLYTLQPTQRDKKLPPGSYLIKVTGADGLTLDTEEFTLKHGDKKIVRVVLLPPDVAKPLLIEPKPAIPAGAPLVASALVMQPAKLPGVQSWTIETATHRGGIKDLAYSPDGKWLATVGQDSTLRLWDAATGKLKSVLLVPLRITSGQLLAWAPDSRRVVVNTQPEASIWDVSTGQKQSVLAAVPNPWSVAWSPDGKYIAISQEIPGETWSTVVLTAETGVKIDSLPTSPYSPNSFSPDGKILAYTGPDRKSVKFWDCATLQKLHTLPLIGEISTKQTQLRYRWSPDGKLFAVHMANWGEVQVFDAKNYKPLASFDWKDHHPNANGWSYRGRLTWLPDNQTLACTFVEVGHLPQIALIEARTGKLLRKLPTAQFVHDYYSFLACSPNGKTLALGCSYQGGLVLYDVGEGQPWKKIQGQFLRSPSFFRWSPDGKKLGLDMSGLSGVNQLSMWETITGKLLAASPQPVDMKPYQSPDGKHWVDPGGSTKVYIFNVATGKSMEMDHPSGGTHRVAWSSDSKWLATSGSNTDVRVWEAASGKLVQTFAPGWSIPPALAFHPQGNILAVGKGGAPGGYVAFFNLTTRKLEYKVPAGTSEVDSLAFSPDGQTLAIGFHRSGTLKLFSADGKKELRTILVHLWPVTVLAWSPDSKVLASGSKADVVRLWDPDTGQPLAAIVPLEEGKGLTISADGHYHGVPQNMEQTLVYVVQTATGQETLTPSEFSKRHGWKNDPGKVKLTM